MKRQEYKIVFEPTGRQVFALPGSILLEAAGQAGLIINTPCGGSGTCGKCRVRVVNGLCPPSANCLAVLGASAVAEGYRLACHAIIEGDLCVEIPDTSLFESQQQILVHDAADAVADLQPSVTKRFVSMVPPSQADNKPDLDRLRDSLLPYSFDTVGLGLLRELPRFLRQAQFCGTVVTAERELIAIETGNTTDKVFGVAFDVGTTTLVGTLVNLVNGSDAAVEARINPQTSYGDDVISRIRMCREDPQGLNVLQRAVIGALNQIIGALAGKAGIGRESIYEAVLAGNTTMQQLLCGIDPSALGELPFTPVFREPLALRASKLGLEINANGHAFVFPQIGGFVGGDTVAGVLASRLDQAVDTALLVDIGTNGEIVLAHNGQLIATSVAAGPAFEGARISCGMRATSGAIEKVLLDGDVRLNVIGNVRPAGLCGSGLIDAVSELLRVGILDSTGRMVSVAELPPQLPANLRRRVLENDGHFDFVLAHKSETAASAPLVLKQKDIRELQLAGAAIRSGINILLQMEGLGPENINRVLLAGGFGNFIRRNHARRIGLLPPIPSERIRFIGNASSLGAKLALMSVAEKEKAAELVRRIRHVDLSLSPEFQMEFGNAMIFPEGVDLGGLG